MKFLSFYSSSASPFWSLSFRQSLELVENTLLWLHWPVSDSAIRKRDSKGKALCCTIYEQLMSGRPNRNLQKKEPSMACKQADRVSCCDIYERSQSFELSELSVVSDANQRDQPKNCFRENFLIKRIFRLWVQSPNAKSEFEFRRSLRAALNAHLSLGELDWFLAISQCYLANLKNESRAAHCRSIGLCGGALRE